MVTALLEMGRPLLLVARVRENRRSIDRGLGMRVDLDDKQVELLRVLLDTTLRDLNYEIADTDLPAYREMLRERREALRRILEIVGGPVPNSEPSE